MFNSYQVSTRGGTQLITLPTYSERWEELAELKDQFAVRDWFMGTSGNISIRVSNSPTLFLVSSSGKDKTKRTHQDFVLVDENGALAQETVERPSAETLLHVEVYKRQEVKCSLHVHTVANNVISEVYGDQGYVTFKGQELIKAFGLWDEDSVLTIPIIENYADIPTLAKEFGKHVKEDAGIVLIRNHGVTAWGRSVLEAKKQIEALEFLCQYNLELRKIGL